MPRPARQGSIQAIGGLGAGSGHRCLLLGVPSNPGVDEGSPRRSGCQVEAGAQARLKSQILLDLFGFATSAPFSFACPGCQRHGGGRGGAEKVLLGSGGPLVFIRHHCTVYFGGLRSPGRVGRGGGWRCAPALAFQCGLTGDSTTVFIANRKLPVTLGMQWIS